MAPENSVDRVPERIPLLPRPSSDRHGDDGDTCRICRGEGTVEEPLFYPCKCSGSIKYVHQECLMEWLSHSQKKYCELCKTSFRFTKLYAPGMPARIPKSVFVRRAVLHLLHVLKTWSRGMLVGSVWLVLLPYCMRIVWRSLFWVGDGGWSSELYPEADGRSRAWNSGAPDRTPAASYPSSWYLPFSQTLNMSAGPPLLMGLLFPFLELGRPLPDRANSASINSNATRAHVEKPSLLSDVKILHRFSSPTANRFLIDVLEGQIITLLVVVAFILIFLIREWVVQQQPVINMVALGQNPVPAARMRAPAVEDDEGDDDTDAEEHEDADDDEGEVFVYDPTPKVDDEEVDHEDQENSEPKSMDHFGLPPGMPEELQDAMEYGEIDDVVRAARSMPREQVERFRDHVKEYLEKTHERSREQSLDEPDHGQEVAGEGSSRNQSMLDHQRRPNMPSRDKSFLATEIKRAMEEADDWSFSKNSPNSGEGEPVAGEDWEEPGPDSENTDEWEMPSEVGQIPESWDDEEAHFSEQNSSQSHESRTEGKGKGKALEHQEEEPSQPAEREDSSRPSRSGDVSTRRVTFLIRDRETTLAEQEQYHDEDDSQSEGSISAGREPGNFEGVGETQAEPGDGEGQNAELEPFPDFVPMRVPEPQRNAPPPHRPLMERILDWVFGDIAPAPPAGEDDGNDEHVVQDLAAEAPFVPVAANEPREQPNPPAQDPAVALAAAQAGIDLNDQDAIDDAEDLEGILELMGMQGPLTGLLQNAIFCAVLISATLACAVWLPYLSGKIVLLVLASPVSWIVKLPLRIVSSFTDLVVDTAIFIFAKASLPLVLVFESMLFIKRPVVSSTIRSMCANAVHRLDNFFPPPEPSQPGTLKFSISSHAALRSLQNSTGYAFNQTGHVVSSFYDTLVADDASSTFTSKLWQLAASTSGLVYSTYSRLSTLVSSFWTAKSFKITLNMNLGVQVPVESALTDPWTATDRLIAILAGYACFALIGTLYLRRNAPFSSSPAFRKVEAIITEILQQAGGVLKVILIISIEMLVFPLYCGLLLDVALLPLCHNATLWTRWQFAKESPWTSGFVHWFIGTCYMFHFALFVSMCRKIVRKGVLYFIRDPDDPTFHPVRDVLERSVTTQLRKIAFSAVVYGALVIICLGGVVWCLDKATSGVLPIHWTTQAPSLEFPLDLLFYNFLTPFIVKFYKPSDGLHLVYEWFFQLCGRALRLSDFLFGEKLADEKGHHVRRTWKQWFMREKGDVEHPVINRNQRDIAEEKDRVYFVFDGKYVRAPASDQARIPKGETVFVEVDAQNRRKDGKSDDNGVHNSDMVTMVYVPPWFRVRIAIFVLAIWAFAAITGVGVTVLPLLFGRHLFSLILPPNMEMNDIHAFSLGIYSLGAIGYTCYHIFECCRALTNPIPSPLATAQRVLTASAKWTYLLVRFVYVWTTLFAVIPFLFAFLLELYFLMPLHAYLGPAEPHVVHIIQDWTLGFLYARLAARFLFKDRTSRAARAFAAVVADGYLYPDAWLATRCFLFPVLAVFTVAVAVPTGLALVLTRTVWAASAPESQKLAWRFCYPSVGMACVGVWAAREGWALCGRWGALIRDEVYLVGERLHNFDGKAEGFGARRGVGGTQ